jgi:hypothetical protein
MPYLRLAALHGRSLLTEPQRKEALVRNFAFLPLLALAGGVLAALPPPAATAADVSFESRTYVPARGTEDETHVLLYEYVTLDAEEIQPGLYMRVGGWGRTDLADETFDRKTNSELQYAFVGWRDPRWNAEARAGRLSLTSGVARNEVFDGLLLGSDLPAGFDVTVYGGIPTEVDRNGKTKDSIYGARLSQGRTGLYRIGASYLNEQDDGNDSREEAGGDVYFAPLPLVELTGSSLYNMIEDAWARHDYRLALGPFKRVRLAGTWSLTDYRYFFQSSNHPAFPVGEEEKLEKIGAQLLLGLGRGFSFTGGYTLNRYDVSGDANAYDVALDWDGARLSAGAGYQRVHGDAAEDRYQQFRAHLTTTVGAVRVAAGAEHLVYEEEINGEKNATTGTLSLSYAAGKAIELTLSGEYGKTPDYDPEVKGLLAVVWRYDASTKKGDAK